MSDTAANNEIRRTLSNIRSLRVFARETEFDLLLDMYEKLGSVIEERREDAEREAKERAEREQKRLDLLQLIAGEGFTPEELLGQIEGQGKSKKRSKTPKAAPKYQFIEDGVTKTWTGKGRKPKPIEEALAAGRDLDEFLIAKGSSQSEGEEQ
ncbi:MULTISPECIES: H-NS family nucleoid-associated regulatory protein [Enterobacterales]|uniref:DNA-binding protein H-NS n=6 Tax=Enterobacterales TaxID=91347 RepID=A0A223LLW3_MORMO|nr:MULTISPECIES: H-NS family nucleoid-associated regulatory protein [Enterobacterales]EAO2897540.1 DNA-binding protein [Salmonella enterica]EEV4368317.1 H-NS histone family protein [Escherichia coli]HAT7511223.1 H-NS histone family protein [Enterobacter asburiae]HBZ8836532.1 H-NS histone family protein [Citrobacter farmeri]AMP35183.1 DNA-binding protein H-NS [Enterobacter cloacae]